MGYCDGSLVARIDGHPDFVKEIMVGQKYIYAPYCSPVIWLWIVSIWIPRQKPGLQSIIDIIMGRE